MGISWRRLLARNGCMRSTVLVGLMGQLPTGPTYRFFPGSIARVRTEPLVGRGVPRAPGAEDRCGSCGAY